MTRAVFRPSSHKKRVDPRRRSDSPVVYDDWRRGVRDLPRTRGFRHIDEAELRGSDPSRIFFHSGDAASFVPASQVADMPSSTRDEAVSFRDTPSQSPPPLPSTIPPLPPN